MPFLTKTDLNTHVYEEIIEVISRQDDITVNKAISTAIAESKSYLSRFDLLKIFGDEITEPVVNNEHLKNIVKDIACWHLIKLGNPNINLTLFRTLYEDAIKFLEKVMKGAADPGYPYKQDDPSTPGNENFTVQWSSNKKRIQHF